MINENKLFGQLKELPIPKHIQEIVGGIRYDRQDYSEFESKYEDVKLDIRQVEELKDGFQKKLQTFDVHQRHSYELKKQKSDLFEAFMLSQAGQAGWFGKSSLLPTKESDDLINGVDMVMEYEGKKEEEKKEKKHLGLALDVTFDTTSRLVTEKFDSLVEEVKRGTLSNVKYFETETGVGLQSIPRLVIGVDAERVDGLLDLWYSQETGDKETKELHENLLKRHYVQVIMLFQMRCQLEVFIELAGAYFHTHLVGKLKEALEFVQGLIGEKRDIYNTYKKKIDEDVILETLTRKTNELRKSIPAIRAQELERRVDKRLGIES